jgi:dihydrofolate reductase
MGKLVVTEFVSLDGVFEEPRWTFDFNRGEDGEEFKGEEMREAEVKLLGRVTYQGFAQAWPSMANDWYGEKMNDMPKYVVSNTLTDEDASWTNSKVMRGDVRGSVEQLKQDVSGSILVHGSGSLVRWLAANELVDEYRLMVFPVLLGRGQRLFGEDAPQTRLSLLDSHPVGPDGVMTLTYGPAR